MAELAINQIIKIILGILVFVVIVISVTFAFKNYIKPYFEGISPSEEPPDLDTPYYKELVQDKNIVGTVKPADGENYVFVGGGSTKTIYYFSSRSPKELYQSIDWRWDSLVGLIGNDGKLRISDEYLKKDTVLQEINMAEKIGIELYKMQS
jgi:hypothetical protein